MRQGAEAAAGLGTAAFLHDASRPTAQALWAPSSERNGRATPGAMAYAFHTSHDVLFGIVQRWVPRWPPAIGDDARGGGRSIMANEDRIIAVYMMANRKNGAIYTGVTSDLVKRAWQHREGGMPGFTQKYGCKILVWYEAHEWIEAAIRREKSLKSYRRQNKINLIEAKNPHWKDLWFDITG